MPIAQRLPPANRTKRLLATILVTTRRRLPAKQLPQGDEALPTCLLLSSKNYTHATGRRQAPLNKRTAILLIRPLEGIEPSTPTEIAVSDRSSPTHVLQDAFVESPYLDAPPTGSSLKPLIQ